MKELALRSAASNSMNLVLSIEKFSIKLLQLNDAKLGRELFQQKLIKIEKSSILTLITDIDGPSWFANLGTINLHME